ncbi:unnamed protein product [Adineta steineri]|uniref:Uncharacterized protein n=1 Tax=Adineta steineri TaxID=433720 RepID=A0A815R3M7_9BILA|nr:unnamed protein product [Adineta steineri]CAF1471719.1 unnamed protein product [Adineta steineri]CAF1477173.1 unnamed protein product [Adineta steineri]CAF3887197.1 unnamed protein product [Adineta steineri]CAF4113749.1 unnamed protein product [Adineta steineri]
MGNSSSKKYLKSGLTKLKKYKAHFSDSPSSVAGGFMGSYTGASMAGCNFGACCSTSGGGGCGISSGGCGC